MTKQATTMRAIRVTFDDGQTLETNINGTDDEIRAYYIGQSFEYDEDEPCHVATAVEFLDDKPAKKTMFYAVFAEQPQSLPDWAWKPWINCDDNIDMTRQLVVNRFIRDRGGIEGLKKVFLYEHGEDAPRHENGNLKQVNVIEYWVSPFKS